MKKEKAVQGTEGKKPFWKKWWFWVIVVVLFFWIIGSSDESKNNDQRSTGSGNKQVEQQTDISFADFDGKFGVSSDNTDLQKKEMWKNYEGKRASWSCEVVEIPNTKKVSLKCNPSTFTSDTQLSFDHEETKLMELKKGDNIKFSGILKGYGLFGYDLIKGTLK